MTPETHRIPVAEGEAIVLDWYPPVEAGARSAVFVHGLGSNRGGDKAVHFAERFGAQGWGFLSLDLRGHGDSDGSMRDLTMTRMLADLWVALDWLAARSGGMHPVLIGSSMGGAVVAWHHVAHPRETGPLVMIAPSLQFPGRLGWQLGPAAMEEWKRTGARRFESSWIDLEIGFGLMDDALNYDPQKLLVGYQAPTLILHGMKDDAVDWRTSLGFVEDCRYPGLDLLLIKEGDHRLTDQKAYLFDAMWAWLERAGGR
ncbi:MAG TPA: alpha/beta fold hydrolase [bacterium]|nr:alpha/beta fold hydrolase [bacterium]